CLRSGPARYGDAVPAPKVSSYPLFSMLMMNTCLIGGTYAGRCGRAMDFEVAPAPADPEPEAWAGLSATAQARPSRIGAPRSSHARRLPAAASSRWRAGAA